MTYLLRRSRLEPLIRILEVLVDIAMLAGLLLLIIKLWPLLSVIFHILTWIAHHLGC
jgi:hypothetical protein